jgi:hypothetical protein
VELVDEAHRGLCLVGNYDFRCALQAEWDTSMEHVVYSRLVLDFCLYLVRVSHCGMSSES